MVVGNVRLGHATNSSSSHSIVFIPTGAEDSVAAIKTGEFGWDNFTAGSKLAKMSWLAGALKESLQHQLGDEIGTIVIRQLFGNIVDKHVLDNGYVDHESRIIAPTMRSSAVYSPSNGESAYASSIIHGTPDLTFLRELRGAMAKSGIVVVGGNDNDEDDYDKYSNFTDVSHPTWATSMYTTVGVKNHQLISRKTGDWWVLFNPQNGAKIRFSFLDSPAPMPRPDGPELVDLKITEWCNKGCSYCYQASTEKGEHGNISAIVSALNFLRNYGVFEVAIGGGEPLSHPNLFKIVSEARNAGIIPSLSTRDAEIFAPSSSGLRSMLGAIGFSVDSVEDVTKVLQYEMVNSHSHRIVWQIVPEIIGHQKTMEIIDELPNFSRVLLLGMKKVGFGKNLIASDLNIEVLKNALMAKGCGIGADTSFLAEHAIECENNFSFLDVLSAPGEGFTSMYVDAVRLKAGKCSFTDKLRSYSYYNFVSQGGKKKLDEHFYTHYKTMWNAEDKMWSDIAEDIE